MLYASAAVGVGVKTEVHGGNRMRYHSCRVHQTLRVSPAMQAKIADHVWEIAELVALLDE